MSSNHPHLRLVSAPEPTPESLLDKIARSAYRSKRTFVEHSVDPVAYRAYIDDQYRLDNEFKADLFEQLGIVGHSKAELLYELAWNLGGCNYDETQSISQDLVRLIRD